MMAQDWATTLYQASTWILPLIVAIPFHEAAHGFVAHRLGDDTAWRLGRVTFNPLKHVDPFGTILLPFILFMGHTGFLFGYAKPVPVDFRRLRNPRIDSVLVAAAGPATNLVLALASAFLMYAVLLLPKPMSGWVAQNLVQSVLINVALAVFNMLPLPPLDGGRVAVGLLPRALALPLARLERYGILLLLALMIVLPAIGAQLGVDLHIIGWLLTWPIEYLLHLIDLITGVPVLSLLGELSG
jgi:Zn-dependent protease